MFQLFSRASRIMLYLVGVEFSILIVVFLIVDLQRISSSSLTGDQLINAVLFSTMMLLSIFAIGAYQGDALRSFKAMVPRLFVGALIGALGVSIAQVISSYAEASALQILVIAGLASSALLGERALGLRLRGLRQRLKPNVLVLGTGDDAVALWRACGDRHGLRLHRFVDPGDPPGARQPSSMLPTERVVAWEGQLPDLARDERIEEIVIALQDRRCTLPIEALVRCRMLGIRVTEGASFLERATGRIDLGSVRPSWLIFSGGFHRGPIEILAKRGFDIAFSLGLLVLLAPLLAVVALAVKLNSPGPVLYRQTRVGRFGQAFSIMKFRTMVVDAEREGACWAAERDPRITGVGHYLRRMRLDEIPQAINVLRGEMSVVGPRPERPEFVGELARAIPYYTERHNLRPGITGWAQINCPYGSSLEDTRLKLGYDLFYLKNYSISLDLVILLRTVGTVLFGDGAR